MTSSFAVEQPSLRWYEEYLVSEAAAWLAARVGVVRRIHVVGCGAGREIPPLRKTFPAATIVASDLSPDMLALCQRNLQRWDCAAGVEYRCCGASDLSDTVGAQLVTVFDNVLTYVVPRTERLAMLHALVRLLAPGACVVGVVHHRWGRISKAAYFAAQALAHSLGVRDAELGDRIVDGYGHRVLCHYFTRSELVTLLTQVGFTPIVVRSLAELAQAHGQRYSPMAGFNNLVFMAHLDPLNPVPLAPTA